MSSRIAKSLLVAALAAAIGCTVDPTDSGEEHVTETGPLAACVVPPIHVDRSLFVSPTTAADQAALRAKFPVSRIMKHLLTSSGAARPADGTELWRRWWDTQNATASSQFPDNPHCDDHSQTINGYPVQCPRNEGALATSSPDSHFPIALVFRPDLAARDGSTCGEARVVIAKANDATGRNVPIIEAVIPNPSPTCGLVGCRKIAQFWANLSVTPSFSQRLAALERFYFTGLTVAQDGVATQPVLNASNLGLPDASGVRHGQIRTNQFMAGPNQIWQLREFQLARACTGTDCRLYFEPVSAKTNAWGGLFNDLDPHPSGPTYRAELLDQIEELAPQDVTAIGMTTSPSCNAGQSNAQGTENRYGVHFALGNPLGFRAALTTELVNRGLALTPDDIVARATTQSCGGCHQLSNNALLGGQDAQGLPLRWPASAGFVHVREDGTRSAALNNVFLPKRAQILTDLLNETCNGVCLEPSTADPTPIGGKGTVH